MLSCCQGWLNPCIRVVKQPRSISCLVISPVSATEPAIPIPLKLWMGLWLEAWNGEGRGDVGPNTPWQLSVSGFVSVDMVQGLGGQKHEWCYEKQRKTTLLLWSESSLFFPVLWPLSGCCPVLGAFRTKRFACLDHYTVLPVIAGVCWW